MLYLALKNVCGFLSLFGKPWSVYEIHMQILVELLQVNFQSQEKKILWILLETEGDIFLVLTSY